MSNNSSGRLAWFSAWVGLYTILWLHDITVRGPWSRGTRYHVPRFENDVGVASCLDWAMDCPLKLPGVTVCAPSSLEAGDYTPQLDIAVDLAPCLYGP